ncbi:MAG: hypothetical protein ACO289_10615 [Prochlorococcaceae cyanobacterium]
MKAGTVFRSLAAIAALAERYGERCGGPVILAGLLVGLGVVQLASGPLAQTSRFSLELLILLVLQLVGPMLVALFALALLLPRWIQRLQDTGDDYRRERIAAAGLVGALLQVLFLAAAVCGGVMGTPRTDLVGEFRDLLGGVLLLDIGRACLRAGVFLAVICGWCQWRTRRALQRGRDPGLLVSDQLAEGFLVLLSLKLLWISVIDPLHLSASLQ